MWTWLAVGSAALGAFWLAEVTFMWVTLRSEHRTALAIDELQLQDQGGSGS
jgi:hypothetical protein